MQADQAKTLLEDVRRAVKLTAEEEAMLLSKLRSRTYLKGQYIVQEGDIVRFQTYLVSGKVRTFYLDREGNEHIVSFGIEHWWVGDLCSFASQIPADFNAQCLEKTEVLQLSYADTEQLYEELPKIERFFLLLLQRAYIKSQKRIVRNHSLTARERYELFLTEHPEMVERFPQYMIASYLGVTKEFLSSIRRQIADEEKKLN